MLAPLFTEIIPFEEYSITDILYQILIDGILPSYTVRVIKRKKDCLLFFMTYYKGLKSIGILVDNLLIIMPKGIVRTFLISLQSTIKRLMYHLDGLKFFVGNYSAYKITQPSLLTDVQKCLYKLPLSLATCQNISLHENLNQSPYKVKRYPYFMVRVPIYTEEDLLSIILENRHRDKITKELLSIMMP